MKSPFVLPRFFFLTIIAALLSVLGGCGQRGPLYMPGKQEVVTPPPKPVPTAPTPPTSTVIPVSK